MFLSISIKYTAFRIGKTHIKLCSIHRRISSEAKINLHMNIVYYFIWYHLCRHRSGCYWRVILGSTFTKWNSYNILEFVQHCMYIHTFTHAYSPVWVWVWFVDVAIAIMRVTWVVKMVGSILCMYFFYFSFI